MHKRPTSMRFAAAATALALTLAAPAWATELQMKKKEDPKAQKQAGAQKTTESGTKKNCPIDNSGFNTLEDLFGLVGPVDPLALQTPLEQQGAQVAATAAGQPAATAAIEWRSVAPAAPADKAQPAPPQKQPPQEQKKD